jgi:SAM-dependent methyltransferase
MQTPLSRDEVMARRQSAAELRSHYLTRGKSYWDRDGDVSKRFPEGPASAGFLRFLDCEAILYMREIQEVGIPFPSSREMLTVGGQTDLRTFLSIGRVCVEQLLPHIPQSDRPVKVLDFGVGCARTARHLGHHLDHTELHGCDVDSLAIDYLHREVPMIAPLLSNNRPPLPYEDGFFDMVYSVSVFTHLNRPSFEAWLRELQRITKPRGTLVITLQGQSALDQLTTPDSVRRLNLDVEQFFATRQTFDRDGFWWIKQLILSSDIDADQFGLTFTDEKRLSELFPEGLRLFQYHRGAISNWQDLAVIHRI